MSLLSSFLRQLGFSSLFLVGLFFFSPATAFAECSGGSCGVGMSVGRASFGIGMGYSNYYPAYYPSYYYPRSYYSSSYYYPSYSRSYYYPTYYSTPYYRSYYTGGYSSGGCGSGGCSPSYSGGCGSGGCSTGYSNYYQPSYYRSSPSYYYSPGSGGGGGCGPGGCPTGQLEPSADEEILIAKKPTIPSAPTSDEYVLAAKPKAKTQPKVGIAAKNSTDILCEAVVAGEYIALVSVTCLEKKGARHNDTVELITPEKTIRATVVLAKNLGDSSAMPNLAAVVSEGQKLKKPTQGPSAEDLKRMGVGSAKDEAFFAALETEYGVRIARK